jgi:hypothetical protein
MEGFIAAEQGRVGKASGTCQHADQEGNEGTRGINLVARFPLDWHVLPELPTKSIFRKRK